MKKTKTSGTAERNMFTTVTAVIIGLAILAISVLILPISNLAEGVTFAVGILLVILCGITAFEGKKGTIKDIIFTMSFWK